MATDAVVVDASVAVKWHLTSETDAQVSGHVLAAYTRGVLGLHAPQHIHYEVPSAITIASRGRQPRLSVDEARTAIDEFLGIRITLHSDDVLVRDAFELAQQHGCAFYDGLYVALAQRMGLPFVTADRKLYELVRLLPGVVWIADWALPAG